MLTVPLADVPAQQFTITLAGQVCAITVYTLQTGLYFDMTLAGVAYTNTVRCLNYAQLCADRQYLGFVGDFIFVDTQGKLDPSYPGLGSRYQLIYLEQSDLDAQRAALAVST